MNATARRVLYLTGTRADFGLMASTLARIQATPGLSLQLAVTGMHLAPRWRTLAEVRASGIPVCAEIPVDLEPATGQTMARAIAQCLHGMSAVLAQQRPDILLLLGDRGEMLAGAIAALHLGVPCAHIHGGERSGTVDEPVRHAISKLASWHFVATQGSRERLLRMGEADDRIHVTGAPGLDGLEALGAMPRDDCLAALGLPAGASFVLCVFHPVVQQAAQAHAQTAAMLQGLGAAGLPVVWVEPNADAGADGILQALSDVGLPPGSIRVAHLARPLFVAAMRHAGAMAGNSSAGIIEAASFGTPVVNVGDRQRLRERAPHVRDVPPEAAAIAQALAAALGMPRPAWDNPWGDGHAGERIAALLAQLPLDATLLEKANAY